MVTSEVAGRVFAVLRSMSADETFTYGIGNKSICLKKIKSESTDEVIVQVHHKNLLVFEETIVLNYVEIWHVLSDIEKRDFEEQYQDSLTEVTLSKNPIYNFCISHFNDYKLNVTDKRSFMVLLNILEAYGETLEDVGEYTASAFDYGVYTRADAAEHYLECNAFFDSWNQYCEFLIDSSNDSIEEFKDYLSWSLIHSDLAITTDGIVEMAVV